MVQQPSVYTFEVVNVWPHDSAAFTQGLAFHNGALFESTGLRGASSLRQVELQTGKILQKVNVPSEYFAEGLTIFQGRIFQLTWQSQRGFIYDLGSFQLQGEFSYSGEGWGLTNDGESLILSDGTHQLRFLDPSNFKTQKVLGVYYQDQPLRDLNELEYIKGEIYANIWHQDVIARIDPRSGKILGWIDLAGLLPASERRDAEAVLNGIAYDQAGDRLFVTGKKWPKLFEIRLKKR
jgi:glutamine cyclotransferase